MPHRSLILLLCLLQRLVALDSDNRTPASGPYLEIYPDPSEQLEGSTPLYFGLMMSLGGDYSGVGGVMAVRVALDEINRDASILPGYTLHYTLADSKCDRQTALDSFFQQIFATEVKLAWLGSGCSVATEPTAEVSHYYNMAQISCQSSLSELESGCSRFRNYFQLLAADSNLADGFHAVIQRFGWRRIALIVQEENLFTVTMTKLKSQLTASGVNYTEKIFESKAGIYSLGKNLFDQETRIYILSMYETHARDLLCEAHRQGFRYPHHLFLLYAWFRPGWWRSGEESGKEGNCADKEIESILHYALAIGQYEVTTNVDTIADTGMTGSKFDQAYDDKLKLWPLKSNYSVFRRPYDAVCYDATYALAYTLNKTIGETEVALENFTYENRDILEAISQHLEETTFNGLSGEIAFRNRSEKDLRIYQYRYGVGGDGEEQLQLVHVADAVRIGLTTTFDYVEGSDDDSVWPGGISYDGVPIERDISVVITFVLAVLASAGIVFTVVCLLFNFVFRNRKLIRLTSPNLNYIIGAGAVVIYLDVYCFAIPSTNPDVIVIMCNITPWLTAIGYSLCFGPILGKMVRIYLLFNNEDMKRSKWPVRDHHLGMAVLMMVLLDIAILLVYMAVEGARGNLEATRVRNRENPDDVLGEANILYHYFFYTCSSPCRDIALGILYGYKAALQVGALVLAFQIRKVKIKGLNDAKYVAVAIYITSVILSCVIVSTYSLRDYVNTYAMVLGVGFVIGTTMVLALVFVPRMIALKKDPLGKKVFSKHRSRITREPLVYMKRREIVTLQKRVSELENVLLQCQNCEEISSEVTTIDFSDCSSSM